MLSLASGSSERYCVGFISIVPYFLPYFTNLVTYISSVFILDCLKNRYDVLIISVSHVSANELDKRN